MSTVFVVAGSGVAKAQTIAKIPESMERIAGRWSHDTTGETLDIKPNTFGWEAAHSRYGQFSLSTNDLKGGANIKLSGRGAAPGSIIDCYLYISWNSSRAMTWNLRGGSPEACLVGKFSKVPSEQEIREEQELEEALKKARLARIQAELAQAKATDEKTKAELAKKEAILDEATKIVQRKNDQVEQAEKKQVATAAKERQEVNQKAANSPSEFQGIEVVYIDKSEDDNSVTDVMNDNKILYSTRTAENSVKTNIINCGPDVPIQSVKRMASLLLEAGVKIRVIKPAYWPQFRNRITLEGLSWASKRPIITRDDVDRMQNCNVHFQ